MDQELLDYNIKKFKASLNYIKKSYLGKKKNKRRKEEKRKETRQLHSCLILYKKVHSKST